MNCVFIAFLFFITNNANYARECENSDATTDEDATTLVVPTTVSVDNEELKELLKSKTLESAAVLISTVSKQASESHKPFNVDNSKYGFNKAYACSKIDCPAADKLKPACACNFNTGNVASFKNKCDAQKHNCRFDTNFKVILDEICPWEFAFRRGDKKYVFDYRDPKYYN